VAIFKEKSDWIICPVCKNKTRTRMTIDTVIRNFPLFCPKCKRETVISVTRMNISVIEEPDASDAEPMNL